MLNKNRKVKGVMEYYLKNFDNNITDYTGNKFDGVTYKSMKSSSILNDKDKKIFNLQLTDYKKI